MQEYKTTKSYVEAYAEYPMKFPPQPGLTFNHAGFWIMFVIFILISLGIISLILLIVAGIYSSSYNRQRRIYAMNMSKQNSTNSDLKND